MPLHLRNLIWHSACTFRYTEAHVNRLEKFKADMLALHFEMEAETTAITEALEEMRSEDTETAIEYTNEFLMVYHLRLRAYNSDITQCPPPLIIIETPPRCARMPSTRSRVCKTLGVKEMNSTICERS